MFSYCLSMFFFIFARRIRVNKLTNISSQKKVLRNSVFTMNIKSMFT